jgi:glutamyl-tRNA synthetase
VNFDGRFAPSPSGPLHAGNLRTALVAWLRARSKGARFLLRIEDLDPQRSRREHEATQIAQLREAGIDWDGEPVRQSERHGLYAEALSELERQGRVYPCWCTRAEIRQAAQAPHGPLPEGAYPGTCRDLTPAQRAQRERETGRPPSLRLDARSESVDDFVLRRHDGAWAYNLAVIVDDADQGIGEVVRGEDLLETTPRQLLIADLLALPSPVYVHVPMVTDDDGRRLAKRDGPGIDPAVIERIRREAEAIVRGLG